MRKNVKSVCGLFLLLMGISFAVATESVWASPQPVNCQDERGNVFATCAECEEGNKFLPCTPYCYDPSNPDTPFAPCPEDCDPNDGCPGVKNPPCGETPSSPPCDDYPPPPCGTPGYPDCPPDEEDGINVIPQPANPTSAAPIIFVVPAGSKGKVLTIVGALLAELPDNGSDQLKWDGTDQSGNGVATGVYRIVVIGTDGSTLSDEPFAVLRP